METIRFNRDGGPLFAEVRSGFGHPGAYTLILWEKASNAKAMEDKFGNFMNTNDDWYELPGSAAAHDGRIVEAFVTVAPPRGEREYFVALRISQDDVLLRELSFSGSTDMQSITIDLFAQLAV